MREDHVRFAHAEVKILGISVDHIWAHRAFAHSLGDLPFPLLADWTKEVCRRYGVLQEEKGYAQRSLFLVDSQGVVRWRNPRYDVRDAAQYSALMEAVASLPAARSQADSSDPKRPT